MTGNPLIRQHVTLSRGLQASTWVSPDYIIARVNGRTCCAHRGWMDDTQLADLASSLTEAANTSGKGD
jgi:hypothetical protein